MIREVFQCFHIYSWAKSMLDPGKEMASFLTLELPTLQNWPRPSDTKVIMLPKRRDEAKTTLPEGCPAPLGSLPVKALREMALKRWGADPSLERATKKALLARFQCDVVRLA